MRILAVLSLITAIFFSPIMATKAEAQCLLCGVVGFALGSELNNEAGASSGSNVIYVAPYIGERIADPLDVRIAVSRKMGFSIGMHWNSGITRAQNMTLQDMFKETVPNHENFTILEIARVIDPSENRLAVFWFAYIENEKMRPLSELSDN